MEQERFNKCVKIYESYKRHKNLDPAIGKDELHQLRIAFREGKMNSLLKEPLNEKKEIEVPKDVLNNVLREYRTFKSKTNKTPLNETRISSAEREEIKVRLIERATNPAKPKLDETKVKETYGKLLNAFVEYKKGKGETKITLEERKQLMEAAKTQSIQESVNSEPKQKISQAGVQEIQKHMYEARRSIIEAKRLLKEGDIPAAADNTMAAGDAMGAVDAATAGAQVPETVTAKIQGLKTAIDDLATEVGIQSPVDMGANPEAGVPADPNAAAPVDPNAGAPMQDPNAAPMMENNELDIDQIKKRIAEREAKIAAMKGQPIREDITQAGATSVKNATEYAPVDNTRKVSPENPPSQNAGVATAAQIAAGTDKGVVRWPNKPVKEVPLTKKVKEEDETCPACKTNPCSCEQPQEGLNEDWSERHVDKLLESEKLNWRDIFKNGLLG